MIVGQHTSNKSISITHIITKSISSLHGNQFEFDPHSKIKPISTIITTTKSLPMVTLKTSSLRPAHKNKVNFDPRKKNKSISVLTLKPSQFLPPPQKEANFDPNTEVESISIFTLKTSQFCMPPDTKTKLISIQTLNQIIFDPHTKPSQLWSQHWNQVNSDPPHWNNVYFDHPCIYQVHFECEHSFSGRGTLRVMKSRTWSCDTAAARRIIYLRLPTRLLDVSVLQ